MSRGKIQTKSTRESRNRAHQAAMRERRREKKARAARYAHLPGQQPTHGSDRIKKRPAGYPIKDLGGLTLAELRIVATNAGHKVRSRHRKADLIAMIEEASR